MYILTSSHYRVRYKEDILRCLALPVGATVQFRYDKADVAPNIWENAMDTRGPAIVCYADSSAEGMYPLVTVRRVEIERVQTHGSTVSILLRAGDFVYAETDSFTDEIAKLSGGHNPGKADGDRRGYFFFAISQTPNSATFADTVAQWERVVTAISSRDAFSGYTYFWTVLAMYRRDDSQISTDVFTPWPRSVDGGRKYELLLYHFRPPYEPEGEKRDSLCVDQGTALVPNSPRTIVIDSRYDLKRWDLETVAGTHRDRLTWIRIGPCGGWYIDLPLTVAGSWLGTLATIVIIGSLVATPAVLALGQGAGKLSVGWTVALQFLFGLAAATAAVLNLRRLD